MGCGLIGGGFDGEEIAGADETIDSENLTDISASVDGESEEEADAEARAEAEALAAAEAAAVTEAAAEPKSAGPLVNGAELARDLAWVHLSQCVSLKSTELAATLISGDWFISSSAEATRVYGYWKIDSVTGAVTPHDTLSRRWQATLDSQCSAESLEAGAALARTQTLVVADAAGAMATVWSFLSRCIPGLEKEIFEATRDPSLGEWVVVTKTDSVRQFGTWRVAELAGGLKPYAGMAQVWDPTEKPECSAEAMASLVTPTPFPTPDPAVKDITEAVTNLWARLVMCTPALTSGDLVAT